jgi:hypothetical protein
VAQYNILKNGSITRSTKREYCGEASSGSRFWIMAVVGFPISALLFTSPYSIACTHYFLAPSASVNTSDVGTVTESSVSHSSVFAAAFGFQAAGSSIITVRTYDGPTGTILSEDSFDVNVKEEGGTEHDANSGRIFAGGIGTDSEGYPRFMLRVYDAESGRFLWEGQLNLLKAEEGGISRAQFTALSNDRTKIQTLSGSQAPFQIFFSLRAVNSVTGALLWHEQFASGSLDRRKGRGVAFEMPVMRPRDEPMERLFDLTVRAYDRTTGTLLWEDSFEQLDRLEELPTVRPYSQAIPSRVLLQREKPSNIASIVLRTFAGRKFPLHCQPTVVENDRTKVRDGLALRRRSFVESSDEEEFHVPYSCQIVLPDNV